MLRLPRLVADSAEDAPCLNDQAARLRELMRGAVRHWRRGAAGFTLAVTAARPGGEGTELVSQLADELAALGQRVVLIDGDLRQAALTLRRGRRPGPAWRRLLAGTRRAAELLVTLAPRVRLLPGAEPERSLALDAPSLAVLAAELAALQSAHDFLLIDAGSEMSPWAAQLWQLGRQAWIVASPDPQGATAAYAAVKHAQAHRLDRNVRLVLAGEAEASRALSERFHETCRKFLCIEPLPTSWLGRSPAVPAAASVSPTILDPASSPEVRRLATELVRLRSRGAAERGAAA